MEILEEGEFQALIHKLCAVHQKEITLLHDKIKFLHTREGQKLFHHHHQEHHEGHEHEDHEEGAHELSHAGRDLVHDARNAGAAAGTVSITTLLDDRTGAPVGDTKAPPASPQKHPRPPWHHDAKGKPNKSHTWFQHKSTGSVSLSFGSQPLLQRMKMIIHHPIFDCIMSALIVINAVMFAFEAQYRGLELARELGISEDGAVTLWPGAEMTFEIAELIFGIIFTVEVGVKILVDRTEFFREGWNWLDFVVVVAWVFGKTGTALPVNSQILRLGRLFRLLRMLRLVRQMKEFDALFLMTTAIRSSFMVLGWTIILLFVCQMLCALVVQQTLFGFYFDPANADTKDDQIKIYWYFGTFTRSLLSLFEMTLANWPPVARLLMENVTEFWVPVCLVHKLTMSFAVVGVINGVLMQETFKVAHMDDTVMVREKQRAMRAHLAKMSLLFDEADTSGDGRLDLEEFKRILKDYEVKIWLAAMDLDVSDVEELFQMLDDGQDGRLSAEELVRGVAKLRGAARAMDLRKIHQISSGCHEGIKQLHQHAVEAKDAADGKNKEDLVEL